MTGLHRRPRELAAGNPGLGMVVHEFHEGLQRMFQDDRIGVQQEYVLGGIVRIKRRPDQEIVASAESAVRIDYCEFAPRAPIVVFDGLCSLDAASPPVPFSSTPTLVPGTRQTSLLSERRQSMVKSTTR